MSKKVKIINADIAIDGRGELLFCNDFNMSTIKRFYQIKNFKNPFVRAWHGHKFEDKYIISREGDRLDLLSYEFYGDPRYWTILANANNLGKGTLDVPAGKQIRIPPNTIITELRERLQKSEEDR